MIILCILYISGDGWTPAHYAAYNGHYDVINELITYKINVDSLTKYKFTPLFFAIQRYYMNNNLNIHMYIKIIYIYLYIKQ